MGSGESADRFSSRRVSDHLQTSGEQEGHICLKAQCQNCAKHTTALPIYTITEEQGRSRWPCFGKSLTPEK